MKSKKLLKQKTADVTAALEKHFGIPNVHRRGDLIDSFVVTMLSQHTSDLNAERAFEVLKSRYPEWKDVASAPATKIADAIRSAGLANQKSVRILGFVKWIKKTFDGYDLSPVKKMSDEEIISLFTSIKGIGIKTVCVVMSFSLNRDVFPVDTHIHRISRRVGLVPDKATAEQTHYLMTPLVPAGKAKSLHVNMLRLGRTICHARKPLHPICPILKYCDFGQREMKKSAAKR